MQEAAVMPLVYGRIDLLLKPWVRKFPLSPVRFWFWKDVVIEEADGSQLPTAVLQPPEPLPSRK